MLLKVAPGGRNDVDTHLQMTLCFCRSWNSPRHKTIRRATNDRLSAMPPYHYGSVLSKRSSLGRVALGNVNYRGVCGKNLKT